MYTYTHLHRVHNVCGMGWLWLVGLIKLEVSCADYRLFYRALLQKRPIISSILLTKATPYAFIVCIVRVYLCMCVRVRGGGLLSVATQYTCMHVIYIPTCRYK